MAISRIDVANRALKRIGAEPIASFEDETVQASQVAGEYETLLSEALQLRRWRFATAEATLVRLLDTPQSDRWEFAYQLPVGLIDLHNVTQSGIPVEYDVLSDKVFTDAQGPLVAEYSFRPEERLWPGLFLGAFTSELASVLAVGMLDNDEKADFELKRAQRQWPRAFLADSQQRTARKLRTPGLIAVRRGRGWR